MVKNMKQQIIGEAQTAGHPLCDLLDRPFG